MKRVLVALVLCLAMLGILAGPALAQGAPLGAVKLALHERMAGDTSNQQGSGDEVGWAIANTNADGKLIVETHLDNGAADSTFRVFVKINGVDTWPIGDCELTTNHRGKGNAHVELDVPDGSDSVDVQVVVLKFPYAWPLGYICAYGYASAAESVPLKK